MGVPGVSLVKVKEGKHPVKITLQCKVCTVCLWAVTARTMLSQPFATEQLATGSIASTCQTCLILKLTPPSAYHGAQLQPHSPERLSRKFQSKSGAREGDMYLEILRCSF